VFAVVTVWLASLATYVGALNAGRILHNLMLTNVMRTPVGFFDVTPAGRLLNRFSKDVDVLDTVLPMTLRGWCNCFFSVRNSPDNYVTLFFSSYFFGKPNFFFTTRNFPLGRKKCTC